MIPRDLHHTPSMAAYKMIRLKFELACKSSISSHDDLKWPSKVIPVIANHSMAKTLIYIVNTLPVVANYIVGTRYRRRHWYVVSSGDWMLNSGRWTYNRHHCYQIAICYMNRNASR